MFRRRSTFISLLSIAFVFTGCGASDTTSIQKNPNPRNAPIEKGTAPTTQIRTESDLFLLAFDELGWNRRAADIAIHKIDRDSQQGCVTYKRLIGSTFGAAQYACTRIESSDGTKLNQRRELEGREEYRDDGRFSNSISRFEQRLIQLASGTAKDKLTGRGAIDRALRITLPNFSDSRASQSTYLGQFESHYHGDVAVESGRSGETWNTAVAGDWESSRTSGDYLASGAALSLTYLPEQTIGSKGGDWTLKIAASSEISFVAVSKCMRPVGTFTWNLKQGSQTKSGTLTTSGLGYLRNDETETIPWGTRCLEK